MSSLSNQQFRLKQEPIDNWSTREKLALATAVQKIGNQNWGPIVRQLKLFAENNRPADWFSPKFCALQYNDMFDKIEAPKRKRGERGEETTQDLIIKKYIIERMEEIKESIKDKAEKFQKLRERIETLQSGKFEDDILKVTIEEIRKIEQKKKDDEIALQKSLAEREIKLSQMSMKFRGGATPRQQHQPPPPQQQQQQQPPPPPQPIKVEPTAKETPAKIVVAVDEAKMVEEVVNNTDNKNDDINDKPVVETSLDSVEQQKPPIQSPKKEIVSTEETIEEKAEENHHPTSPPPIKVNVAESSSEENVVEIQIESSEDVIKAKSVETDPEPKITSELMNEESSETNETVFEDAQDTEIKVEVHKNSETPKSSDIKIELTDIKVDPDDIPDVSQTVPEIETSVPSSTLNVEQLNNISYETPEEENTPHTPSERVGRRKRQRSVLNSSLNISTRSTRSHGSSNVQQENHHVENVTIKEEIKSSVKRHKIQEEMFAPSPSEDSNESKTNVLETSKIESDVYARWKKASLILFRTIQSNRAVPLLMNSTRDDFRDIIHQKIDLSVVKKKLENGQIRSDDEFKYDLMLVFLNNLVINTDPTAIKMIKEFAQEVFDLFEAKEEPKIKTRDKSHKTEVRKSLVRRTRRSTSNEKEITTIRRASMKSKILPD